MNYKLTNPLFCAIDSDDLNYAETLASSVGQEVGGLKLGKEFFTAHGPTGVRRISEAGNEAPIFLDLKFHDIPNTVARAVKAACSLKPYIINVHASGGAAMLKAAIESANNYGKNRRPMIVAVTMLTSLNDQDLESVGFRGKIVERAVALAKLAKNCGLDGVVCSAAEISAIRNACGAEFVTIVPGVRTSKESRNDQKRTCSPAEALSLGATYLVIGRPITSAPDPVAAVKAIKKSIEIVS